MLKLLRMRATTAAFVFAASVVNAPSGDANAAQAGEKGGRIGTHAGAPRVSRDERIRGLEVQGRTVLAYISFGQVCGWGSSGRLDKGSAEKEYAGLDCEIKSYAISDVQMTRLGRDAALLTHKLTIDGTCGGQKNPPASWAATVYVREGDQWKAAFHAEAAIVDPAVLTAKPAGNQENCYAKQNGPRIKMLEPMICCFGKRRFGRPGRITMPRDSLP